MHILFAFMKKNIHFSGIAGAGMSALAQMAAGGPYEVTGSDRDFDRGQKQLLRRQLENLGIRICAQDGSAISASTVRLVVSTAIEDTSPEIAMARRYGVPVAHRSEVLAEYVNGSDSIVVSGTSGKSTVAAMLYCILEHAGLQPSIITGGSLIQLMKRGLAGNAFKGKSDILVVEGDESDGSLVRYKPKKGLALNITKDHKSIDELKKIFLAFKDNCIGGKDIACDATGCGNAECSAENAESETKDGMFAWNYDDKVCREIFSSLPQNSCLKGGKGCMRPFGKEKDLFFLSDVELKPFSSSFMLRGVKFSLPVPGNYNIYNAIAACAGAEMYGVSLEKAAEALKGFAGVDRRFVLIGEKNGIKVVDDFAHNPAKLAAVISALHGAGRRVFAVYQPHGFAPTRNLRAELVQSLASSLFKEDFLFMPEIYYAGGTVNKTISSADIVNDVRQAGKNAEFFPDRAGIPAAIAAKARPGDIVGVMGARDSTLTDLARAIAAAL